MAARPTFAMDSADVTHLHYRQLQEARYAMTGVPVPEQGLDVTIDAASFHLESGSLRPMEPIGGVATGFVFTGKGRFQFAVPNAFERAQLKRFSHGAAEGSIDTSFSALIVRSADPYISRIVPTPADATYAPDSLARDRRNVWLKDWRLDVDARVIAADRNPNDDYVFADVKTAQFGWMCVQLEPWNLEELTLTRLPATDAGVETWVSLDRASERDADGNPTSDTRRLIDLEHAEIFADLGNHRAQLLVADGPALPDPVTFRVRLDFQAKADGISALPFELDGKAEITAVRASDGTPLTTLRDNYGKSFALVADEQSVPLCIVVLERPLRAGEACSLEFDYTLRTLNFVSGREWYPGPPDGFRDRHTTEATIVGPKRLQVRAVGTPVSDTVDGDRRTSVWRIDHAMNMYGFSFGSKFQEESIKLEGAPEVLAFGVPTGGSYGKLVRNVAVDVARSQKFFQEYFGLPLPITLLRATAITGYHGQAFEGFLHLAQDTFNAEHPGQSELFRAHEVAHQYWGHLVGWKSYRDEWLSEGFAEYSALLFVEAVLPKAKYFDPMIHDMVAFQLGSLKGGTIFYPVDLAHNLKPDQRADLGPVAAGYRASTSRVPIGYEMQCYEKGALVLHTIRTVLSSMSRERDLFRETLGDFLKAYQGGDASTPDFKRFLDERVPFAWGPFFETYVYGTEIPTFAWRWSFDGQGHEGALNVTVNVSHAADGFVVPVPLAIEFKSGKTVYTFVQLDGPTKTFRIPAPEKPVRVTLNPNDAILARIEPLK
jgi:peptidase M1-like protein